MRRYAPLATLAALTATTAIARPSHAQSLLDASARGGVVFSSYHLGAPLGKTISELAVPLTVTVPVADRLDVEIGTAWASSVVTVGGARSTLSGLTDTQLRANYSLAGDAVVLTAGLNLPTGRSTVTEDEILAAGQIGSDFFAFPVSSLGTGFGGTGGIAAARTVGSWNVGAGLSLRYSGAYEPFRLTGEPAIHYQPGNEYRFRVGGDRPLLDGRLALGLSYSTFGHDVSGPYTYSTGDRYVLQGAYSRTAAGVDWMVRGWNLLRTYGQTVAGPAPWENIADLSVSGAVHPTLGLTLEPSLEVRAWSRDAGRRGLFAHGDKPGLRLGENVARMAILGLRARGRVLGLTASPSLGVALGGMQAEGGRAGVVGWNVGVGIGR